ncbi:MAG TPA: LptF/LptG family permease [Flavobacterium sp.]
MKILDKYILRTFVGTFITVFVILFFIFILQTVWLFIAELAGKDLDFVLIVKFLLFSMPRIIPLVLPLSILLASIMTFGNFAENYEFAAMKSSGISLQRAMRSLIVFILVLSAAAFVFANNVIPYAEFKFINFRKDIAQQKPAMAIAEGQFSEVGTYNIKVDKKSGDNGNLLSGVTIHKKSSDGGGTSTVIKSKNGELVSNEESSILKLVLKDGYYYEDVIPKKYEQRKRLPFAKSSFKKYVINMDLSKLNDMGDDEEITNTNTMLNVNELTYTLDSLDRSYEKDAISFADNSYHRTGIINTTPAAPVAVDTAAKQKTAGLPKDLLSLIPVPDRLPTLKVALSNVESVRFSIDSSKQDLNEKLKNINKHYLALYDKFVIAFACILMFFIGAPLGAIIRKGGLGLPIVFAILIFITFHFINTFGKRLASENGMTPFLGAWMSSIILVPLAVLLTYRATNDIGLINMDRILMPLERLYERVFPNKEKQ